VEGKGERHCRDGQQQNSYDDDDDDDDDVNPLIATLKLHSNRPPYSNTVIGKLAVDGCCGPAQSSPHCTKCNSPPINGQCTNLILFDVTVIFVYPVKVF